MLSTDIDVTFSKSRIDIHHNFIAVVIGIHYNFITDVIVHYWSRRFTTFSAEKTALILLYISTVGLLEVAPLLSPNVNFTLFKMYSVVMFIVWSLIAILSLTLNITCLVVLRKCTELEDVPRAFLTSMSAADLGICIFFVLPAIGISVVGRWPFGDVACAVQAVTVLPCCFAAVFSLLIVNIDRYISIEYLLKYHTICNVKRARIAIFIIYPLCFSLDIVLGFVVNWIPGFAIDHYVCVFYSFEIWLNTFRGVMGLLAVTICITGVIFIYIRLFYISRGRNDRIAAFGGAMPKRDTKSSMTFFYVGMSMAIGYFPYLLIAFVQILGVGAVIPGGLIVFTRICFASNGWWNVLIYYSRNKRLRVTFTRLIQQTLFKRKESDIDQFALSFQSKSAVRGEHKDSKLTTEI